MHNLNSISSLSVFRTLWLVIPKFYDCVMRLIDMSSGSRGPDDGDGGGGGAAWKDVSPVRSNKVLIEIRNTW